MAYKVKYAKIRTSFFQGMNAELGELEISIAPGLPSVDFGGVSDASVKEVKSRVKNAIRNSGFIFPNGKITVNLLPVHTKKQEISIELPMALGILFASGQVSFLKSKGDIFSYGGLSLDGRVQSVLGAIPRLVVGQVCSHRLVPYEHSVASEVSGISAFPARTLLDAVTYLKAEKEKKEGMLLAFEKRRIESLLLEGDEYPDYTFLKGQEKAKRGLLIAASGFHNILFSGSPGSGKTTAAHILMGILPSLSELEKKEVLSRKSLFSNIEEKDIVSVKRPLRKIHSLRQGGLSSSSLMEDMALSRHGILFLDEMNELPKNTLQALRIFLEGKEIGKNGEEKDFGTLGSLIVGAMNPCRCGRLLESDHSCTCTEIQRRVYKNRISGALYDRMDMIVEMQRTNLHTLKNAHVDQKKESFSLRERVEECWQIQYERNKGLGFPLLRNGQMQETHLYKEAFCITDKLLLYTSEIAERLRLSTRGYSLLLRVARTIGDMEKEKDIKERHILEAVSFRKKDGK